MVQLPPPVWLAILAIAGLGVLGVLYVVSARIRDYTHAHNLRIQAVTLRIHHLVQLKAMSEYRDLDKIPRNLESQIRYLIRGIYPGDSPSEVPDQDQSEPTGAPIPLSDQESEGEVVDPGRAAAA